MNGFQLRRLGLIMEPEPGNPLETEGVLNPAAILGTRWQPLSVPAARRAGQLFTHRDGPGSIQ